MSAIPPERLCLKAHILGHWRLYADILIAGALANLFVLALPLYSMTVYDRVVPNFAEDTLIVLTIGIFILFIFDAVFRSLRAYLAATAVRRITQALEGGALAHVLYPGQGPSPATRVTILRSMAGVIDYTAGQLIPALMDIPFVIGFILVIGIVGGQVAWVIVAVALLMIAVGLLAQTRIGENQGDQHRVQAGKYRLLADFAGASNAIAAHDAGGTITARWQDSVDQAAAAGCRAHVWQQAASIVAMILVQALTVLIIVYGVYAIHAQAMTTGALIAVTILGSRALSPVMALTALLPKWRGIRSQYREVQAYLAAATPPQVACADRGSRVPEAPVIEARAISFHYPGQKMMLLKQCSLKIMPGERVAILGRNGAGKSTLLRALAGLLPLASGQVLHYGLPNLAREDFAARFGVTVQPPEIMAGTLGDAVRIGRDIPTERMMQVCRDLGMDGLVYEGGQGLNQPISEQGANLSTGQKQALVLARALAHDPEVVLLDEPSSGMDQTMEASLLAVLQQGLQGKTVVLVTHRVSLLAAVDRLIFVEKGQIVLDGPKAQVMAAMHGRRA